MSPALKLVAVVVSYNKNGKFGVITFSIGMHMRMAKKMLRNLPEHSENVSVSAQLPY